MPYFQDPPARWDTVKINCPLPNGQGTGTQYLTGPGALKMFGALETARLLTAVGYCVLIVDGDCYANLIGRINRTAWYQEVVDIAFATREDWPNTADAYRRNCGSDRIRGVPSEILKYMTDSYDPCAPTVIMKKADLLLHLETTPYPYEYEYPAMTEPTEATLEMPTNLPALEAMPMKVVIVTFPNDNHTKEYHYFAPVDAKVGDHAVVYAGSAKHTPEHRGAPFSIGLIAGDSADLENRARSAILGTFNEEFAKHVQQRMDYLSAVKAKLQQKKRQFEETKFFEMMAESDPEAAELLKQLKQFRV